jgi:hypothetical protein
VALYFRMFFVEVNDRVEGSGHLEAASGVAALPALRLTP